MPGQVSATLTPKLQVPPGTPSTREIGAGSLGGFYGVQEVVSPIARLVHILDCDMEIVQQSNEPLHPYPLESLVTDNLDRAYDEPPQPWGEWYHIVKTNEALCTEAE